MRSLPRRRSADLPAAGTARARPRVARAQTYPSQFPGLHASAAASPAPLGLLPDSLWVLLAGFAGWFTCVVVATVRLGTLMLMRNGTVKI